MLLCFFLPVGLLRPGLLYRAALEGATLSLAAALSKVTEFGLELKELRLVGGGSKNPLWQQIVADVFQLPVRWDAKLYIYQLHPDWV